MGWGVGGGDDIYGGAAIAAETHVGAVGFNMFPFAGEAELVRVRMVG